MNKARGTGFKRREQDNDEPFDLGDEILLVHETNKAYLVEIDGDEKWIPKSLVQKGSTLADAQVGEKACLILPMWFAKKEGLV